jgi:hypothetical protein
MLNGIWTNKNSITLTNGAGGGTAGVTANTATYVGSIYCTANGQTGMAFRPTVANGGTNNIMGVWNAYNRVNTRAVSRDNTTSWTYGSTTWRAANNNVANRITWLDGLQQSQLDAAYETIGETKTGQDAALGVNLDGTDSATIVTYTLVATTAASDTLMAVFDTYPPQLGLHYVQATERNLGGTAKYFGTTLSVQCQELKLMLEM